MPIKIVVNGYFRSGTTFVWDYLRVHLEERVYLCLYEPLHPDLANLIIQYKKGRKFNKLHNKLLFEDYLKLEEKTLNKLLRNNPNANPLGINSDIELINYLDLLHSIPQNIFLKPNRLNFHLELIFENYTNKVIHIIRHPLDVWNSIMNAYGKDSIPESNLKKMLRMLMKKWRLVNSFEIEKNYNWIIRKIGYPYNFRDSLSTRVLNKYNAFEKFVVVWTISNYYAIKSIKDYKGLLLVYESIIANPIKFKNDINIFIDLNIKDTPDIKRGNYFKFKDKDLESLRKAIEKYKLYDEFTYVVSEVNKIFEWKI